MRLLVLCFVSFALSLLPSCGGGKKNNSGKSIGAPKVEPPVQSNTPAALLRSSLNLVETTARERLISAVQEYLVPSNESFVGALKRLKLIDEKMTELDTRAQETQKKCLTEAAKAHSLADFLPMDNTFPLFFQCQEKLNENGDKAEGAQLAFGLDDDFFYLFERTGTPGIAVLAKTNLEGKSTEYWQLASSDQNGQNYIHLKAEDDFGMEMTSAGTVAVTALDCGFHMKTKGDFIYLEGYDNVNSQCQGDLLKICVSASDFSEVAVEQCSSISTFTLETLTRVGVAGTAAETIVSTPITGFTDFIEDAESSSESTN